MDSIKIICISTKSSFIKEIKGVLIPEGIPNFPNASIEVVHLSSISKNLPSSIKNASQVVIVDYSTVDSDLSELIADISDKYAAQSLVIVADDISQLLALQDEKVYLVDTQYLASNLFRSFISCLVSQSDLIQTNLAVKII